MARLERSGDREELVTSDGIRLLRPPFLDDSRLADYGIEPLATGPEATAEFRMPGRVDEAQDFVSVPRPVAMDPRELAARQGMAAGEHGDRTSGIRGYSQITKAEEQTNRDLGSAQKTLTERKSRVSDAEADRLQREHDAKVGNRTIVGKDEGESLKALGKVRGGGEEREAPAFASGGTSFARSTGGGPARLIRGGMQLEQVTRQQGADKATLEDARDASDRAVSSGRTAANAETEQQIGQNHFEANQLDSQISDQLIKVGELRGTVKKAADAETDMTAKLNAERDEITKFASDPPSMRKMWANAGTGTKLLTIFGALMAGMAGPQHDPLKQVKDAIADDMMAHREKLAAKERGAKFHKDEYDRIREKLDPDLAERELEARKLYAASLQLRQYGLVTGDPAIIARSNAGADKMEADAKLQWAKLAPEIGDRITEVIRRTPDRVVGGTPAMKPEQRERIVSYDGGQRRGFVVAGNARDKVQSAVTGWENLASGTQQLRALAAQAHAGNLDAQRRYNSIRSAMLTEGNVLRGQGAMSEGDQENMEQGLPDISDITTSRENAEARLSEQERLANQRLHTVVRDNVYEDPDATAPVLRGTPRGVGRAE